MPAPIAKTTNKSTNFGPILVKFFACFVAIVFLFVSMDTADAKRKKQRKYSKKHYKANHRVHRKIRRKARHRISRKTNRKSRRKSRRKARPRVYRVNPQLAKVRTNLNIGSRYFKALNKFYSARAHKKVWINSSGINNTGTILLGRLSQAYLDGLDQSDFNLPASGLKNGSFQDDVKISYALIRYAEQVQAGRLMPAQIVAQFDLKPQHPDLAALLKQVSTSKNPGSILDKLPPPHRQYGLLKAHLADLRNDANLTLPGADADAADFPLRLAVKNIALKKQNLIIANMERWRWIPRQLGKRHVWVNLPSYKLHIKEDEKTTFSTKGIVGRIDKPTPLISSKIKNIIVNPFWHIPASVVASDILPKLQTNNVEYLKNQSIKVLRRGGRIVDPEKVDWTKITNPRTYRFRQSPGKKNALGKLKVLFPNSHSIYLHDTDEPELFKSNSRAFSHGCVRLANPVGFADAIAAYDDHLHSQMPGTLLGPRERWLKYKASLPVHLVYFTAEIDASGTMKTYPDIYNYDEKTIAIFKGKTPSS